MELFPLSIEVLQFVTGRGLMGFDDVFNNTVGLVLGILLQDKKCVEKELLVESQNDIEDIDINNAEKD